MANSTHHNVSLTTFVISLSFCIIYCLLLLLKEFCKIMLFNNYHGNSSKMIDRNYTAPAAPEGLLPVTPPSSPCNQSSVDSGFGTATTTPNRIFELDSDFPELCVANPEEIGARSSEGHETKEPVHAPTPIVKPRSCPPPGFPGFHYDDPSCLNTLGGYEPQISATNTVQAQDEIKCTCELQWGPELLKEKKEPELELDNTKKTAFAKNFPLTAIQGQENPILAIEITEATFAEMECKKKEFFEKLDKECKSQRRLPLRPIAPQTQKCIDQLAQFDRDRGKLEIRVIDSDGTESTFKPFPANNESPAHQFEYDPKAVSTIFRIFYHGDQCSSRHFIAGSTLRRLGWRLNHRDGLWYHRVAEPKVCSDVFEIGTYDRFNTIEWTFERVENFRFEYS